TVMVDGKPAVELTDDPGNSSVNFMHSIQHGLRLSDKEHPPRAENHSLSVNGEVKVVVSPTGQAERHDNQLWVNGQQVGYPAGAEGFRMVNDLSPFGAAPDVQGSVYYLPQSDQPALIVLKGKTLTLRP